VLPVPRLHVIVLLVAFEGATVPESVSGVPAVVVEFARVMPVTATKGVPAAFTVIPAALLAVVAVWVPVAALLLLVTTTY
jgi:hypothetical protein